MRILTVLFLVFILTGSVFAGPGLNALQFLRLGIGAGGTAVGGAYSAVAKGVDAIYWNPAGLCSINKNEVMLSHINMFSSVNLTYLSYATPLRFGAVGFSFAQLSSGNIDQTKINPVNQLPVMVGTTEMKDAAFTVSYSNRYTRNFRTGCSIKLVQEDIADASEKAVLADIGGIADLMENRLSLSVYLKNIGTKIKFDKEEFNPPSTLGVGAAYLVNNIFMFSLDVEKPQNNNVYLKVGGSTVFGNIFRLRGGYRSNNEAGMGISMGFGVVVDAFEIDYSYEPNGGLNGYHQFTLNYSFKSESIKKIVTRKKKGPVEQLPEKDVLIKERKEDVMPAQQVEENAPTLADKETVKNMIRQKKYDLALDLLNKLIGAFPEDSEVYSLRGDIYFETGQIDNAIEDYQKAKVLLGE